MVDLIQNGGFPLKKLDGLVRKMLTALVGIKFFNGTAFVKSAYIFGQVGTPKSSVAQHL
jgi:hypothetical protein